MINLEGSKQKFQHLTHEQKYGELVTIFDSIKNKNNNCFYIYQMLYNRHELFNEVMMNILFDEVIQVYEQIQQQQETLNADNFSHNRKVIEVIHWLEQQERETFDPDTLLYKI